MSAPPPETEVTVFEYEPGNNDESLLDSHIKSLWSKPRDDKEDAYMGLNLGTIRSRMMLWKEHLSEIEPCMDCTMVRGLDPVIKVANGAGVSFYALSKKELKTLVDLKVDPQKIIFGQAVKQIKHLQYAKQQNVGYLVFDSAFELHKIRADYRDAQLLIRVSTDSPDGSIAKYGRSPQSCKDILNTARMLGLKVSGVVAVVGHRLNAKTGLKDACATVRSLFDHATKCLGYSMETVFIKLNIDTDMSNDDEFIELAGSMNRFLLTSFRVIPGKAKQSKGIKIIVDPGELFIKDSVSLAATIIGVRRMGSKDNKSVCYYINESVYQSFTYVRMKPSQKFYPVALFYISKIKSNKCGVKASVFGYADTEEDIVAEDCLLPGDMSNGDVLCFHGLGPYVKTFAGDWIINSAAMYYFCTTEDLPKLLEWIPEAKVENDKEECVLKF